MSISFFSGLHCPLLLLVSVRLILPAVTSAVEGVYEEVKADELENVPLPDVVHRFVLPA